MSHPTARQQQVLEFLKSYIGGNGYPPTLREICDHLGVSGTLSAMRHLDALEKKGFITRSSGSSRGIRVTLKPHGYPDSTERIIHSDEQFSVHLPVVGTVRAGIPQPPVEDIQEYCSIDRNAARSGGAFFLRVKGDSMINASIREGDLALIRPQETARNRDIVVALVDGEATLKRFCRESDHIRLEPENSEYAPIIIREGASDISIIGKVVGIYRSLE